MEAEGRLRRLSQTLVLVLWALVGLIVTGSLTLSMVVITQDPDSVFAGNTFGDVVAFCSLPPLVAAIGATVQAARRSAASVFILAGAAIITDLILFVAVIAYSESL